VTNLALNARRWVMACVAGLLVGLALRLVEGLVGIGHGWTLVVNQLPITIAVFKVLRWSEAFDA
jgi:hypothetical protein